MVNAVALPVVVIGAGVAGVSAAVHLADAGVPVVLLEKTDRIGGRASSFHDRRTGVELDFGQHIIMGCCTEIQSLYGKLGSDDAVSWYDRMVIADEAAVRHEVVVSHLPAPLHMVPSFASGTLLAGHEKAAVARLMARIALTRRVPARLHRITAARWFQEENQPAGVLHKLWEPLLVGAVNAPLDRFAASEAWFFLSEALLKDRSFFRIGVPRRSLSGMLSGIADRFPGVTIHLRTKVESVDADGCGVVLVGGERIAAAAVISAVPPWTPLSGVDVVGDFAPQPIVGAALVYDEDPMDLDHISLLGRPTHWFFRHSLAEVSGGVDDVPGSGGFLVTAVRSAALDAIHHPPQRILDETRADLAHAFPSSAGMTPRAATAIKAPEATFLPSLDLDRPAPGRLRSGVYLAGEWTATGWPSTMEGAARSGRAAAEAVLADLSFPLPASSL